MAYGTETADKAEEIAPNDTANLTENARALYVGGAGDLKIKDASGATVTFTGLAAGSILPVRVSLVYATDTTATGIVALY